MKRSVLRRLALLLLWSVWFAAASWAGSPLSPAPQGSFSIVVIPDSQCYKGRGAKATPLSQDPVTNAGLEAETRWIADNLERQRIVFVSHVGDIVDKNTPEQWEVARRCMDHIHGRVPYGISLGNHDTGRKSESTLFQQYFPRSRFAEFKWYGGCFEPAEKDSVASGNNSNSCQLFSAAGLNFVILHLECNAPDEILSWADGVFEKYADRRALVTTHMDLGPLEKPKTIQDYATAPTGRMKWAKKYGSRGNTPDQMWQKCFRKHANLSMIFSGDQGEVTALWQKAAGDHGNTVYELLSDYSLPGVIRINRFLPAQNQIQVITYDTLKDALCEGTKAKPGRENHQFTIPYDMTK